MCAHLYYIRLVEHSTCNWGTSSFLQIFVQGERRLEFLLKVLFWGEHHPPFTQHVLFLNLETRWTFVTVTAVLLRIFDTTSIARHRMPALHTVCYSGKQVGPHHQPSCTEWTSAHLPYHALQTHGMLHKQACHRSHGHSLACCCNWRRYTASVEHSKLNELLSRLGRASLQRVSPL